MAKVEIPAPAPVQTLMDDAAQELFGDYRAHCVLIVETRHGELAIAASPWDVGEIRGLMFRAASELPTDFGAGHGVQGDPATLLAIQA